MAACGMAKLVYSMHVSLDGYVEDPNGNIDFAEPDEDVHRAANEQARATAAFLYGRGLYDAMEGFWTDLARAEGPVIEAEFARAYVDTPRIVVSDTLDTVPDGVRLVRRAGVRAEVARLKAYLDGEVDVAGPTLAASLLDLIDEFRPIVFPVVVGGGKPFFPRGRAELALRLTEQRVFASGVVYLAYERAG
jgi:dihydrofolate reductase